jgi:regulator of cell morphogenesis and NO signaling
MKTIKLKDCTSLPLEEMVAFLQHQHHKATRQKISAVNHQLQILLRAKGTRSLLRVYRFFLEWEEAFAQHLNKEENLLFPFAEEIARISRQDRCAIYPDEALIESTLAVFKTEHASLLKDLSQLANDCAGFITPAIRSLSLQSFLQNMLDLRTHVEEHIHLENNCLYPELLRLEHEIKGRAEHERLVRIKAS